MEVERAVKQALFKLVNSAKKYRKDGQRTAESQSREDPQRTPPDSG